eukprot:TRINITY_DN119_c0_g1_i1.p2 TRINITY_DN119_c0_g1~~TRINITY_DN119_c0_g1_i1.p2  ORF type:complete len:360 (-),score=62.48 TRINITY_DN119_c0_g1_i1:294-1373(-)
METMRGCRIANNYNTNLKSVRAKRQRPNNFVHCISPKTEIEEQVVVVQNGQSQETVVNGLVQNEQKLHALEDIQIEDEIEKKGEWVAFWIGSAMLFAAYLFFAQGSEKAEEFVAGYLLEQSLSVDNLMVFILIFEYFKTPKLAQGRCLSVGIATAAILRLVMIVLGVEMVESFKPVLVIFAAILVYSSLKLLLPDQEEEEDEDLSNNWVVKYVKKIIKVSDQYDGDKFFTVENGIRMATPLVLALAVVELSDVIFAVDSIPAIFGVTLDPFIVYSSNMLAILSLRALYGFVSIVVGELRYLEKSVAAVLGFIGLKLLLDFVDIHITTEVSLVVVALTLAGGVAASYLLPDEESKAESDA